MIAMIGQAVYNLETDESKSTRLERIKLFSLVNWKCRAVVLPIILQNATIAIKSADDMSGLLASPKSFLRQVEDLSIRDTGCKLV